MRTPFCLLLVSCISCFLFPLAVLAQITAFDPEIPHYEIGGQFSGLDLRDPVTRGDAGIGAHFGYNYNRFLSLEAEVNAYRIGTTAMRTRHTTTAFFGTRIGYSSPNSGIYLKLRPGFIHFPKDSDLNPAVLQSPTHFAFDTGLVLLRRFPGHTYLRLDAGSVIVNYGSGPFTDPASGAVTHLGIRGNPSVALGFGLNF